MENYPADDLPTVTSLIPLILREIVRWGRLSTMPRVLSMSVTFAAELRQQYQKHFGQQASSQHLAARTYPAYPSVTSAQADRHRLWDCPGLWLCDGLAAAVAAVALRPSVCGGSDHCHPCIPAVLRDPGPSPGEHACMCQVRPAWFA